MPDIDELLESALAGEPAATLQAGDVVASARRRARRHQAIGAASVAAVLCTGIAVAVGATDGGTGSAAPAAAGSPATRPPSRSSAPSGVATSSATPRLTARTLPGLVERYADVQLTLVDSTLLHPPRSLDLGAGIVQVGATHTAGQYLNVQVYPADRAYTGAKPDCAALQSEDGYRGRCTTRRLPGGAYLLERSGRTATRGYTITAAEITRPDGSGVSAEATNQRFRAPKAGRGNDPVVTTRPPLTSAQLVALVRRLAAAGPIR